MHLIELKKINKNHSHARARTHTLIGIINHLCWAWHLVPSSARASAQGHTFSLLLLFQIIVRWNLISFHIQNVNNAIVTLWGGVGGVTNSKVNTFWIQLRDYAGKKPKEMFYLFMVIWRRIYGKEPFMGCSFRLAARYILYMPSHIQHFLMLG